jgi:hypothetical protein
MVKKPDARLVVVLPCSIQIDRDRNLGLCGVPFNSRASHTGAFLMSFPPYSFDLHKVKAQDAQTNLCAFFPVCHK